MGDTAPHYNPSQDEQDAEAAYHRMELLSQSIRNELQRDLHIHDSAVLPNFINLPQVCPCILAQLHGMQQVSLAYQAVQQGHCTTSC